MERKDDDIDRLGDLPDSILLHIMQFMDITYAVQTCILSTRWKHLWKCLTVLTFDSLYSRRNKFISSFLSSRDDSISVHKLDLCHPFVSPKLLNWVMTYAASHHVQQLLINVKSILKINDFVLPSSIFYCRSLTSLNLSIGYPYSKIKLPKSLELPALKSLHMKNVTFATTDNGCAQPFSTCHMLNTLVIEHRHFKSDVKVLCIFNSKLFSLTIINYYSRGKEAYEITLSTPNLNILTVQGDLVHQLSSTCNITCLEEVKFLFNWHRKNVLFLISWLQVLFNLKIMTLNWSTFWMLNDILSCPSIRTQLPCFVKFKSLKLEGMYYFSAIFDISDEGASRLVEYLLHNSPLTRVDIIRCYRHFTI